MFLAQGRFHTYWEQAGKASRKSGHQARGLGWGGWGPTTPNRQILRCH
jgi:hypothetical protein